MRRHPKNLGCLPISFLRRGQWKQDVSSHSQIRTISVNFNMTKPSVRVCHPLRVQNYRFRSKGCGIEKCGVFTSPPQKRKLLFQAKVPLIHYRSMCGAKNESEMSKRCIDQCVARRTRARCQNADATTTCNRNRTSLQTFLGISWP